MLSTDYQKPTRANRWYEGWSDQLSCEAAVSKGLRRTLFGKSRVRRTREQCWQSVRPSRKTSFSHVTTTGYNTFGQRISVQGPITSEPPTTFTYDSNGTLSTTTAPLNHQTRRLYDAVSRLTRLTAPHGFATQFRYDALNRVTDIADARQGLTRFTYDPNGNLLSVTDAKHQTTTYIYDHLYRLQRCTDALNR